MADLLLDSLEIKNFRAFKHLRIEKLGRVNLIVGKNNVGKTSVLEALRLYARRGSPSIIWELLESRDELSRPHWMELEQDNSNDILNIRNLFYGRNDIRHLDSSIKIGSVTKSDQLFTMSIDWFDNVQPDDQGMAPRLISSEDFSHARNPKPTISIEKGEFMDHFYLLDEEYRSWSSRKRINYPYNLNNSQNRALYVSSQGLREDEIIQIWDSVALTRDETDVIRGLGIIHSGIERISLINDTSRTSKRVPIVKLRGEDNPVTLRSLGEGMNRLFSIVLALISSRDGFLLIDEVESGLHYSVQADMWRLIFETAHRLNIQVFATTHSWDCILAFQHIANEDTHESGVLTRLAHSGEDIIATSFDEAELAIVADAQIEVR